MLSYDIKKRRTIDKVDKRGEKDKTDEMIRGGCAMGGCN